MLRRGRPTSLSRSLDGRPLGYVTVVLKHGGWKRTGDAQATIRIFEKEKGVCINVYSMGYLDKLNNDFIGKMKKKQFFYYFKEVNEEIEKSRESFDIYMRFFVFVCRSA